MAMEKTGLAEARVLEAKADATYKQGNADARVLTERLTAEAEGAQKLGQANASATQAMGDAEASNIAKKMSAEAEGLTSKFDAMGKMSPDARSHEEFRMLLETQLRQLLASIDAADFCHVQSHALTLRARTGMPLGDADRAVEQARAEGFDAVMEAAVSAEDCLYADLGIDPGLAARAWRRAWISSSSAATSRTFSAAFFLAFAQASPPSECNGAVSTDAPE